MRKAKNNGDRLRSMDNAELAAVLSRDCCPPLVDCKKTDPTVKNACESCWNEWLNKVGNADKLRSMDNEEITAMFHRGNCPPGEDVDCLKHATANGFDCKGCWIGWLNGKPEVVE